MAEFIHSTTEKRNLYHRSMPVSFLRADDDGLSRCIKLEDTAMFLKSESVVLMALTQKQTNNVDHGAKAPAPALAMALRPN